MRKFRSWIWHRLIFLADRISPEDAFHCTGISMSLRKDHGWVLNTKDGEKGVMLWYRGSKHYTEMSHARYDEPV
jgi:hypothetical protein